MTSGILHPYYENLTAFEYSNSNSKKVIIFIGGLGDGFLTVPYVLPLAQAVESQGWSLIQILTSSSYKGWGTSSLKQDSKELFELVKYFKSAKGGQREKVVIAGHSTGCQDVISYLSKFEAKLAGSATNLKVDGGVLQASVSDREALTMFSSEKEILELISEAKDLVQAAKTDQILLPSKFAKVVFDTPITGYRFLSLTEKRGDDDYFSSDLLQADFDSSFGKIEVPVLLAYSGSDEFVPGHVDKGQLVRRWAGTLKYPSKYSGVIEGATHNVGPGSLTGAAAILIAKVVGFLQDLA